MGTYETFFVATDDELDALFPGWKAPGPTKRRRERTNPYRGTIESVETEEAEGEPESLGTPSFLDDVWGPRLPPIKACSSGAHERLESTCAPGLAALPHHRTRDGSWLIYGNHLVHLMLDEDEADETPPLRMGAGEDQDVPLVFGWSAENARAFAACPNERLDELAWEILANDSNEDEVEVAGEDWANVRRDLRAVRALARRADKAGSHLCVYLSMRA